VPQLPRWLRVPAVLLSLASGPFGSAASPSTTAAGPTSTAPSATPSTPQAAPASAAAGQHLRAFFSGHSLLDNPLPDWIESIAASRGDTLSWQEQIVLGSPIRVRTRGDDPDAHDFTGYQLGKSKSGGKVDVLRELASPSVLAPGDKYDRLVITERADLLGAIEWENTIGYLRDFHDRVIRQNPRATTLLYEVWPEIEKQDPGAWVAYVQAELFGWECVAARVNYTLSLGGRADRVSLIPGGLALSELVQRALAGGVPGVLGAPEQRVAAIFKDEVHLTPLGIYLLAAVHYATLFGKSPVGAPGPAGVNAAVVPLLQQIAWDTVSKYRERAAHAPTLAECGTRVANELCPAYKRFHGKPEDVDRCKSWSTLDSPFAGARPAQPRRPLLLKWGAGAVVVAIAGYGYRRRRLRAAARA
jgi:hypothetical protein